jgi:hypothetical protein
LRPPDWQSSDAAVAGVPLLLTSLLLLASHIIPAASAVAIDSAVTDVIVGIDFPWAPAVVIVSTALVSLLLLLFLLLLSFQDSLLWLKYLLLLP